MYGRRKTGFIYFLLLCFVLTGCSYTQLSMDELLVPPKLSEEQEEIYTALNNSVKSGTDIKLLYPSSGNYRSAFVICNIDEEPTDEALVFYSNQLQSSNTSSSVCVSILDQEDGNWVVKWELPGDGTRMDKVMIVQDQESRGTFIVLGYGTIMQNEKNFCVYRVDGDGISSLYAAPYYEMETFDIDGDGTEEMLYISSDAPKQSDVIFPEEASKVTAKLLKYQDGEMQIVSSVDVAPGTAGYVQFGKSMLPDESPALYLDGYTGKYYNTQILMFRDGVLQNPIGTTPELLEQTARERITRSADVDGDGVLEIPTVERFPGYEEYESADALYLTNWSVYNGQTFEQKYTSYVNTRHGFIFKFPERWKGVVSAKAEINRGEVVFFLYNGSVQNDSYELLRLRVVQVGESDAAVKEGYSRLYTQGQLCFMYKLPENEVPNYALSVQEVIDNFGWYE